MVFRCIAPDWAIQKGQISQKTLEGQFSDTALRNFNSQGYNVYYFVNQPDTVDLSKPVDGSQITKFSYCFVDMDLKDEVFSSKAEFISLIKDLDLEPTKIVDSGNGVHIYWKVQNMDAMSYLRFQRRLMRLLNTDEAVSKICQLMRYPGTYNTKTESKVLCEVVEQSDKTYTAEQFDKLLPAITNADEQYCKHHYDKTYNVNQTITHVSDKLPVKFGKLLASNPEVKELWAGATDDRSINDWRLGQLLHANDFTKDDARIVLAQTAKALRRAPVHRVSYAQTIIDKIWTFEQSEAAEDDVLDLSESVKDILRQSANAATGLRFSCHPMVDNTTRGYRLGDVLGMVGGSGVGKTGFTMNMFRWFAERNPEYHHFYISLEQPVKEIAERWKSACGEDSSLHEKVHIVSNYDKEGNFRHLSLYDIKTYLKKFQKVKNIKIGCVVIDHIGALKKKSKDGENQGIVDICHEMKAFAVETNTFLIMQSQASREKAGIGDLELDKDAAYGTVYFESYCDFLLTIWQPVKRMHSKENCPTVTAFKFCKIRHKKPKHDTIQEDVAYFCYFDTEKETIRDLTEIETKSFDYWMPKAVRKRNADKKTDIVEYKTVGSNGKSEDSRSNKRD